MELFQSTLPRGERQLFEVANAAVKSISIHAPTRGATFANAIKLDKLLFQSTLPRGERRLYTQTIRRKMYFNPRSHEGSDIAYV